MDVTSKWKRISGVVVTVAAILATSAAAAEVRLADKGEARCVIVLPPGSMAWAGSSNVLNRSNPSSEESERRKRLQRDSAADL